MCSKFEAVDDLNIDCEYCSKLTHGFWEDPVGKFIDYFRPSRQFKDTVYVISHKSPAYDAQFCCAGFWN